ncbi:MAG: hypothetical protein A2X35_09655 [Elusimicrobia bacterium GWA2_61_42]|nr:MAG: hypothetical protein A2X35_09655 [Elusimicrobia bacterium GWA2_61_42]OGR78862.1 MAG: hypothetical protein A2X38_04530 [Elusimicrobia bacterium GWC2_61_25]
MKISTLPVFFAALLLSAPACAADFTFLRPGARANAMGTAFSTVEDDAYAVFYNPANLTTLTALETRFETGRRLAPGFPEGEVSLAYIRPVPDVENKTAGFGYYAVRQGGGSSFDSLTFGTGKRAVIKYFQQPVFYGTSFRLMSLRYPGKSQLGLGVDAGLRLESDSGLRTSLVLSDLMFGLGRSLTTITLGNSYRLKNSLFLADLKARGSYSEVFLGLEQQLFNGLLAARAGKGVSLGGGRYLALGLGVNTLPWTIDLAWSIPWAGYNEISGYYGFNVGYRFGSRNFSEKLVGDASRQAETLKNQIDDLRLQRSNLESAIATYRVNKGMLETDLTMMQSRMREMETNLRELQLQTLEVQYKKENPKPVKKYSPPAPERWPKLHKAAAGETLRSIASRYYGNPNLWERIYEANEKNISKGLPAEGAILTIPAPPPGGR